MLHREQQELRERAVLDVVMKRHTYLPVSKSNCTVLAMGPEPDLKLQLKASKMQSAGEKKHFHALLRETTYMKAKEFKVTRTFIHS
jgi:hypothetical protein